MDNIGIYLSELENVKAKYILLDVENSRLESQVRRMDLVFGLLFSGEVDKEQACCMLKDIYRDSGFDSEYVR